MRVHNFLHKTQEFLDSNDLIFAAMYADSARFLLEESGEQESELLDEVTTFIDDYFPNTAELLNEAKAMALAVRQEAFAPYSHFQVGAALIAEDASIWRGCNVEASSYGLTICAERNALVSAVAHGKRRFACVVVATDTEILTPPCGACRQFLYDFAEDSIVILVNLQGKEARFTLSELLPAAFSAKLLG